MSPTAQLGGREGPQYAARRRLHPVVGAGALAGITALMLLVAMRLGPEGAWSADIYSWLTVADMLRRGANPYNATTLLTWPPFWMQCIYAMDHLGSLVHLRLVRVIQLSLAAVDCMIVAAVYLMLRVHWKQGAAAWLVPLLVLALNPTAILLIVIHGNFDVLVGAAVLAAVFNLARWHRHRTADDWLWACLLIGLGGLIKTVPLILAPLLLTRWRALTWSQRVLGAVLVAGPIALGLSIIYVLGPAHVKANVFHYRSQWGIFGITGLIEMWQLPITIQAYTRAFDVLLLVVMVGTAALVGRRRLLSERSLVTIAAALLMMIPVIGPGWATQYVWWWLPLLPIILSLWGGAVRAAVVVMLAVLAGSYALAYSLYSVYGAVLLHVQHPAAWDQFDQLLGTHAGRTTVMLPLFGAYLLVLATLSIAVADEATRPVGTDPPNGVGAADPSYLVEGTW
jgi:hypothetical protein